MPQTKPIIEIVNVVASASVGQKIDLLEITKAFPEAEYNPAQFPGLVFRLKSPRTALSYSVQANLFAPVQSQKKLQLVQYTQ